MQFGKPRGLVRTTLLGAMLSSGALAQAPSILDATYSESGQSTPQISTAEFRRTLAAGEMAVIDTRSRSEFEAGHIAGAHLIEASVDGPVAAVERLLKGDKGAAVVLYCNGPFCQMSRRVGEQMAKAGFTQVHRYQLGIPVWRALGGPIEIELPGIARVFGVDHTAVFIDARTAEEFAAGSLPGAANMPAEEFVAGRLKRLPLPEDDFNRRVILFGRDRTQARRLAEALATRPWHNVAYFPGEFAELMAALK
jgi:rhodanese-related sulfurtransferase